MTKRKNPIVQVGVTLTGKPILAGLFKMHDTLGFALTDAMWAAKEKRFTPSIPSFVADAVLAGWPVHRVAKQVRQALVDSHAAADWASMEAQVEFIARHPERFNTKRLQEDWQQAVAGS